MNRFVPLALALICALPGANLALAADAGIPANYKTEIDPSSHRSDIVAKVQEQITKLANDADPTAQSAAREWLVNEAGLSSASATSAAYVELYGDVLNKSLEPLVKNPDTTPRAKVNAVLIAGRVAESSGTANMLPTILAAINDKNEAIVLLGEKAAGQILPAVFKNASLNAAQDQKSLLDAIVNAVAQHLASTRAGPIVEAAYSALNPSLRAGITVAPATNAALADAVIHLQQIRLAMYTSGIPDSPDADANGSLFLMDSALWDSLSKTQKFAAMQNAVNLIWCAAQRASQMPANGSQDLIHTIANVGQMVDSVANKNLHSPALDAVMQPVVKLSIGSNPSTIIDVCRPVFAAVQASSPDFKDLKAPPELVTIAKPAK